MNVVVGNKLKILRLAKNWSQEQVADYLQISQSAYARIERGAGNSWATYIRKICELYTITPEELVKEGKIDLTKKENSIVNIDLPPKKVPETEEERFEVRVKLLKKIMKYLQQMRDEK